MSSDPPLSLTESAAAPPLSLDNDYDIVASPDAVNDPPLHPTESDSESTVPGPAPADQILRVVCWTLAGEKFEVDVAVTVTGDKPDSDNASKLPDSND